MSTDLPALVSRSVTVPAPRDLVWRLISTNEGWSAWWGPGSTIDARPGGAMSIAFPDGRRAAGTVQQVEPPTHLTFTFGYDREDAPVPVDGSLVELTLADAPDGTGTIVQLLHRLSDEGLAALHEPGWRYQLGLFRDVVARANFGPDLTGHVDQWHAAWGMSERDERRRTLLALLVPDAVVDEPMATLQGPDEIDAWIEQARAHLPATVKRSSPVALNGAHAMWSWEITDSGANSTTSAQIAGTAIARLAPDGRFKTITSFWLRTPPGLPSSALPDQPG
jgi:uncharacterized protein YndB with AHSA1/START domain